MAVSCSGGPLRCTHRASLLQWIIAVAIPGLVQGGSGMSMRRWYPKNGFLGSGEVTLMGKVARVRLRERVANWPKYDREWVGPSSATSVRWKHTLCELYDGLAR